MNCERLTSRCPPVFFASLFCFAILAGCSSNNDPYGYVKVSGTVTYDDGTNIPVGDLYLYFASEAPATGNLYPPQGSVKVEKDGSFRDVTSHTPLDGIVRGKHKVTLCGSNKSKLPESVVAPEYFDVKKSPLEVDTAKPESFNLKVHKPAAAAKK
jgi:hypothetical protein